MKNDDHDRVLSVRDLPKVWRAMSIPQTAFRPLPPSLAETYKAEDLLLDNEEEAAVRDRELASAVD